MKLRAVIERITYQNGENGYLDNFFECLTYHGSHTYPRPHPAHLAGRQEQAEETSPSDLYR